MRQPFIRSPPGQVSFTGRTHLSFAANQLCFYHITGYRQRRNVSTVDIALFPTCHLPPTTYHLPATVLGLHFVANPSRAPGLRVSTQKDLSIYYASNIPTIIETGMTKCLSPGRFIYLWADEFAAGGSSFEEHFAGDPIPARANEARPTHSARCEPYHEVISQPRGTEWGGLITGAFFGCRRRHGHLYQRSLRSLVLARTRGRSCGVLGCGLYLGEKATENLFGLFGVQDLPKVRQ